MNNEEYKKQFEQLVTPFVEAGLLKVIYNDENVSVCNLANTTYALFSYQMLCEGKENFVGILFNGKYLNKVVENPIILLQDYVNCNEKQRVNMMVPLNQVSFKIMKDMKNKTDVFGPSKEINLELEQELMVKNKNR